MHISTSHVYKLFSEWFPLPTNRDSFGYFKSRRPLLLQIGAVITNQGRIITNRGSYCKSGHMCYTVGQLLEIGIIVTNRCTSDANTFLRKFCQHSQISKSLPPKTLELFQELEAYSEPCQTCQMELFAKIVNG